MQGPEPPAAGSLDASDTPFSDELADADFSAAALSEQQVYQHPLQSQPQPQTQQPRDGRAAFAEFQAAAGGSYGYNEVQPESYSSAQPDLYGDAQPDIYSDQPVYDVEPAYSAPDSIETYGDGGRYGSGAYGSTESPAYGIDDGYGSGAYGSAESSAGSGGYAAEGGSKRQGAAVNGVFADPRDQLAETNWSPEPNVDSPGQLRASSGGDSVGNEAAAGYAALQPSAPRSQPQPSPAAPAREWSSAVSSLQSQPPAAVSQQPAAERSAGSTAASNAGAPDKTATTAAAADSDARGSGAAEAAAATAAEESPQRELSALERIEEGKAFLRAGRAAMADQLGDADRLLRQVRCGPGMTWG